jgi:ribonucleotide reductase alpha subunit
MAQLKFSFLSQEFLNKYKNRNPDFGFGALGHFVYKRTYSRVKDDGSNEEWYETVERVVNGVMNDSRNWVNNNRLGFCDTKGIKTAEEMYDKIYNLKFVPPGRGLWTVGTDIIEKKKLNMANFNCCFITTQDIHKCGTYAFRYLMDLSMLGCGVGFDTRGAGKIEIREPIRVNGSQIKSSPYKLRMNKFIETLINNNCSFNTGEVSISTIKELEKAELVHPIQYESCSYEQGIFDEDIKDDNIFNIHHNTIEPVIYSGQDNHLIQEMHDKILSEIQEINKNYDLAIKYINDNSIELPPKAQKIYDASNGNIEAIKSAQSFDWTLSEKKHYLDIYVHELAYLKSMEGYWVYRCIIADTREGWVEALGTLLDSYIRQFSYPFVYNYDLIRKEGAPLKTFGGTASGPRPLIEMIGLLRKIYDTNIGRPISERVIVDTMNLIGKCVVSGNVRRCLPENTFIRTTTGFVRIDDLKRGDSVVNSKGISKVINVINQGVQKLICVETRFGNHYYTEMHRIAVKSPIMMPGDIQSERYVYRHIRNLQVGDLIVFSTHFELVKPKYTITKEEIIDFAEHLDDYDSVPKIILQSDKYKIDMFLSAIKSNVLSKCSPSVIHELEQLHSVKYMQNMNNEAFVEVHIKDIYDAYEALTYDIELAEVHEFVEASGIINHNSSLIALGTQSEEFINLKNYGMNPERSHYGWASNNSIYGNVGQNYHHLSELIANNGEPGIMWLENARNYSRMSREPDYKDLGVMGTNPCGEISLESGETCNLSEIFISRHDNLEEFLKTIKYAYMYSKIISLGSCHWSKANRTILRNRRIGCSISGVVDFIDNRASNEHSGLELLRQWITKGYDEIEKWDIVYSKYFAIPRSIKKTTIKPSGTVSLLAGVSPGCHWPIYKTYIRRVRVNKSSKLIEPLRNAGYKIEPCIGSEATTVVIEFPVKLNVKRDATEVSIWEKAMLASFIQEHWSDNQVSITIDFNVMTEKSQIEKILDYFQYKLKAVSFLPVYPEGTPYAQMPYERITEEKYSELIANIKKVDYVGVVQDAEPEMYCDGEKCIVLQKT